MRPVVFAIAGIVWLFTQPVYAGWNYRIGEAAPEFQLEALDGNVLSLSGAQGQVGGRELHDHMVPLLQRGCAAL